MRYYVSVEADFDKSFEHLIKLRSILEGDSNNVMYPIVLGDVYYIGFWIYQIQQDLTKSKEYAKLMLSHSKKYNLNGIRIYALMGLAELEQHSGNVKGGIKQFKELELELVEMKDSLQLNRLYLLLSNAYIDYKKEDSAFYYGKKAYQYVPNGNAQLKAYSTISLARGYISKGKIKPAIKIALDALSKVENLGAKKEIRDIHDLLSDAFKEDENYKESLFHLEKFLELDKEQASLVSSANISNLEAKLEKKKHQIELQKEQQELIKKDAKIKQQKTQAIALIIGLLFALGLIVVSIRSYLIKKRDAETIKHQKNIVEEKNKEILDSISYAKRIQTAILPPNKVVKEYLNNSFILYKPKDIVAGDFYWMETISSTSLRGTKQSAQDDEIASSRSGVIRNDELILFAAADCTGHGVPGAMVSVICNNGLNRSVREHKLTDPGEILDKTREIVIAEFEKSEEEVKDGMDIALCSLSVNSNQSAVLQYAGANNPLWIISPVTSGADEGSVSRSKALENHLSLTTDNCLLYEIKANKQPIGKIDNPQPYTTHTIELQKGDTIYIFSDGYADQFGGDKGKKLKSANFKKLLLSIQNETMEKQRQLIDEAFENWKGNLEQLDDVCVIGVRI